MNKMLKHLSGSPEDTEMFAEKLAPHLHGGDVVALFGGMGAGKTTFVRGLARGLGFKGDVFSPTFALVNEYHGGREDLYHFDMYRVTGEEDLYSTGFYDFLDLKGVMVIEWSENILSSLPDGAIRITLDRAGGDRRRAITIEGDRFENTMP